ncbi:larval cuticle protein 16/17-like [Pollicipes pollicipes]|uniref:larval cuticle protein 16/17-like n=1 Tax=Pollicipes pollicipes TaxID=41117 RepID=UPI001884B224|nr:larval cuticle protein 16/17-like [Pollicipes pollicipes]
MKLIVISCLVALAMARPQDLLDASQPFNGDTGSAQDAGILRMENVQREDGSFQYGFETVDSIVQDVTGQIKQIGEEVGVVMQGSYSFIAKDENGADVPVSITWTADENGFQAQGDAIPVAPEGANPVGAQAPEIIVE